MGPTPPIEAGSDGLKSGVQPASFTVAGLPSVSAFLMAAMGRLIDERRGRLACDVTRREREILGWVEAGKTNPEIAEILCISPLTVRKHLENTYEKLGVRTRTAAVARPRATRA